MRDREKTQGKLDTYNQFRNMPTTTKAVDVDRFYKATEKALKPAALTSRDKISIQTILNRKNKLNAYLEGSTEVTVFSGATEAYWGDDESQPDASGMNQQRQTVKKVQMTPKQRKAYEAEIQSINESSLLSQLEMITITKQQQTMDCKLMLQATGQAEFLRQVKY